LDKREKLDEKRIKKQQRDKDHRDQDGGSGSRYRLGARHHPGTHGTIVVFFQLAVMVGRFHRQNGEENREQDRTDEWNEFFPQVFQAEALGWQE
jgi:hypothetical protein